MDIVEIHTNFTYTVETVYTLGLADLLDADKRLLLKWAFTDPEQLRPNLTRAELTEDAAARFARLAKRLRDRGYDAQRVAHFMNKLLFSMFAESIGLLPTKLLTKLLELASRRPQTFGGLAQNLFQAMKSGGLLGLEEIDWFNGGLFDDDDAVPLQKEEIDEVLEVSRLDWSSIEPSIFGTLFERGLDPDKRSQLGAHFTDPQSIMRIVDPVVLAPLRQEWEGARQEIASLVLRYHESVGRRQDRLAVDVDVSKGLHLTLDEVAALKTQHKRAVPAPSSVGRFLSEAGERCQAFLHRLESFRVLDPACGSGNFLYLALLGLKDLEHQVITEAAALGLPKFFPAVGPSSVMGIEVNIYAAELARVTVWIGQIQWMLRHGWGLSRDPILKPLDQISCRDAILNRDGSEAEWPGADAIIGNPPFLGDRQHLTVLGPEYTKQLRTTYAGRVAPRADLVVYWFIKATEKLLAGQVQAFGLVATKSIAKGASRAPLDLLANSEPNLIYNAWTNEPWVVEGAAVRVSIVCAAVSQRRSLFKTELNGSPVDRINPDLTSGINVTVAGRLSANSGVAFQGVKLTGPFDISGNEARDLLLRPRNPNGRTNVDVIARLYDIEDVLGRDSDRWVIDFGAGLSEHEAALYEAPFEIVVERVIPFRTEHSRSLEGRLSEKYWEFQRPRPKMRRALSGKVRFIVTPESSEHRIFVFAPVRVLIQGSLFAIAREDDVTFGILSSRIHEIWATAQGNRLGVGNQRRYNKDVVFETFPFPEGLTPDRPYATYASDSRAGAIAEAASRLNQLREAWLNPPDLVRREPEVVPEYPDRIIPRNDNAAQELKQRTLTNLYNERPSWLQQAHERLDAAVANAYGWPVDLPETGILDRILTLNLQRENTSQPEAEIGYLPASTHL